MLCLRCGQREQFAENLCSDCLARTCTPYTVDPVLHGTVCPECNRVRKGKTWVDLPGTPMDAAVMIAQWEVRPDPRLEKPRAELGCTRFDKNVYTIEGEGKGIFMGMILACPIETEVRIVLNVCPYCSRRKGNYYEAILQLRGVENLDEEELENLVDKIRDDVYLANRQDPNVFLTRDDRVRGGHDFYFGNNSFARQTAGRLHDIFGGTLRSSNSLFGRKDGKEIYRNTYLVRLPGFIPGDYLVSDKARYRVLRIHRKVHVKEVATGKDLHIELEEAMSLRRHSAPSIEHDLVVVMEDDREISVMHPVTFKVRELVKPPGYSREPGDTVRCAIIEGEIYLVS